MIGRLVLTHNSTSSSQLSLLFADNFFRTGGLSDYFACEEYRKIVFSAYPDPSVTEDQLLIDDPHNNTSHIPAPALAFIELKVRTLTLHTSREQTSCVHTRCAILPPGGDHIYTLALAALNVRSML